MTDKAASETYQVPKVYVQASTWPADEIVYPAGPDGWSDNTEYREFAAWQRRNNHDELIWPGPDESGYPAGIRDIDWFAAFATWAMEPDPREELAVILWRAVNDELAKQGRPQWPVERWIMQVELGIDVRDRRCEVNEYWEPQNTPGRKSANDHVHRVRKALTCSDPRARAVVRNGTAIHAQRVALATEFKNVPGRDKPIHWRTDKEWGGHLRRAPRDSFAAYVAAQLFEADGPVGVALGKLDAAIDDGWLDDTSHDGMAFLDAAKGLDISADLALTIWRGFKPIFK